MADTGHIAITKWYRLTLGPGEDLFQALRDFCTTEGLSQAYVLSCIGSLERVVLAYPKTKEIPPEIERITLEGLFEITGIAGNIKREGDAVKVHLHGSLSRAAREVYGGAINEGTKIFKVAELVIAGVSS